MCYTVPTTPFLVWRKALRKFTVMHLDNTFPSSAIKTRFLNGLFVGSNDAGDVGNGCLKYIFSLHVQQLRGVKFANGLHSVTMVSEVSIRWNYVSKTTLRMGFHKINTFLSYLSPFISANRLMWSVNIFG
jgi:hypothetical protein